MKYAALPGALLLLAGLCSFLETSRADPVPQKIDFNRQIRPILSNNCFQCHGPEAKKRRADLRLDTKAGAFADLGGHHAIVPGNVARSKLIERITSNDKAHVMPPPSTGKTLKADEIELLRQWIEQGAKWEDHWAFVAPRRAPLPVVKQKQWTNNAIDYFVLARLEKEGLSPAPEADRRTLIRRVTLDLTGLPPTPQEVEAFVNDPSPNAYEKVVDRLLASQHYGEHRTRFWLDAARYGDTHGLHLDNYREIWPFRDWVINAFNNNLPYDQFVLQQLAGDLLPNPSVDQLVATGFNRCHVTTSEGGSIAEEVHVRNVVDRVDTFGTVFLGLTVGCAVCHDHKFDPISQAEFYQLSAFFNSLDGSPLDGNAALPAPVVRVPTRAQKQQLQQFQDELAGLQKEVQTRLASVQYVEPKAPRQAALPEPTELVWIDDDLPAGAQAIPAGTWQWVTAPQPVFSGRKASTRTAPGLSQHVFQGAAPPLKIGAGDRLFAYVYLDPKNPPQEIMLQFFDGNWEHRAYWGADKIAWGQNATVSRKPLGPLPSAGQWVRLEVDTGQVGLRPGAAINGWAFTQFGGTVFWDRAGLVQMPDAQKLQFDSLAQWEAYQRKQKASSLPKNIQDMLNTESVKRTPDQQRQVQAYFVEHAYAPMRDVFQALHARRDQLDKQRAELEKSFPSTLVWKELATPRPTYLLKRGQYDQHGPQVKLATPAALPPLPKEGPVNRLALAKWLVSPEQPLTARVAVNRFWQQYFGTGLVKTSEDFGNQGEAPSHPELLDWLAVEFRDSGWDMKRLHRRIVTSATYRQSTRVTPELLKRDPFNILLARGPRVRLDAEMIRDQALAVSGLLVHKVGGPSVKPPQPELWSVVAYVGSNTMTFTKDMGPDKVHRRSLYTFWKRTSPPPQMNIFDAPSRESCVVRRERTNTPLQALMLMNDPQYVEAARAFGERILREGGQTTQDRITFAFHLATARPPTAAELAILVNAQQDFHAAYQANPKTAQQLIQVGESPPDRRLSPTELATWTMMANVILNLDEVINKN